MVGLRSFARSSLLIASSVSDGLVVAVFSIADLITYRKGVVGTLAFKNKFKPCFGCDLPLTEVFDPRAWWGISLEFQMDLSSNRFCGKARYCLRFPYFGRDLILPEGFDPRVLGCN